MNEKKSKRRIQIRDLQKQEIEEKQDKTHRNPWLIITFPSINSEAKERKDGYGINSFTVNSNNKLKIPEINKLLSIEK